MKISQAAKKLAYSSCRPRRGAGLLAMICVFVGMPPTGLLLAALGPGGDAYQPPMLGRWTVAQSPASPSGVIVPPVRREAPQTPPAPQDPSGRPETPAATPPANQTEPSVHVAGKQPPEREPEASGFFWTIQEWLARANREYQGVVVKELSLPPTVTPPDDEIEKKLKEQQAEEASRAAAAAKALDARTREEDRKKVEETKRLADEAKKKADELSKAESEKGPEPPSPAKTEPSPAQKPEAARAAAPAAPQPEDAAQIAEQQRLEAQRLTEEAKRQDQMILERQHRAAEDARRLDEQRRKAAATAKSEDERRHVAEAAAAAGAAAEEHRSRTVDLTVEPIVRSPQPSTSFPPRVQSLPSTARDMRIAESQGDDASVSAASGRRVIFYRETVAHMRRAFAVQGWVWRSHGCRAGGRRITPPARYTVKRGDSLWRISARHYHKGRLYPKIYRANRAIISDPDLIYPCQRVRVPRR